MPTTGIACGQALERHVSHDQQSCQQRIDIHAAEGADTELQQDTCQQTGGDTRRDQADELVEIARQTEQDKGCGRDQIRPTASA